MCLPHYSALTGGAITLLRNTNGAFLSYVNFVENSAFLGDDLSTGFFALQGMDPVGCSWDLGCCMLA